MATPKAPQISISEKQKEVLIKITRQTTADFREVSRAALLLEIEKGNPNSIISKKMNCSISRVSLIRYKWLNNQEILNTIEADPKKNKELEKHIRQILGDNPRKGAPPIYTSAQYCQILSVSLEPPEKSGRPISQWTARELADECNKREITSSISPRQVGRFLKRM